VNSYFFDTYALIELIKGNPYYTKYSEEQVVIMQFNLVELYYSLISEFSKEMAKMIYLNFKECVRQIDDDTIFEAMDLRKKQNKKRLSYVDCIGYVYAKRNKIRFLTGDKQFENMPNVEFVK